MTLASLALALLSAVVEVTARPEDTRCPGRAALAAALDGRVPEAAARWSLRYRVEARAPENHIWLELRDDQGELRLRRELAIPDAGCEAAADGIALIVARFFREVSWTGAVPLPDMERAPEPPPPPVVPPGRPFELQLGAALRREVRSSPGLALEARFPVGKVWLAAAGFVLQPLPVTEVVGPGTVRLWSFPLRLSFRRALTRGPLGLELGPEVTVALERAEVASGLKDGGGTRLFLAPGAVVSARWAFAAGWTFAMDFSAGVTAVAPAFTATLMVPQEILTPRRVQIVGVVGLSRAF